MLVPLTLLPAALLLLAAETPKPQVAVTFDDLPYVGSTDLEQAQRDTEAMLNALDAHGVVADVFITGGHIEVGGDHKARLHLLRRWRDAGHQLHNHGYSHLRYSAEDIPTYLDDVRRGEDLVRSLLSESDTKQPRRYFRAPYNDLGDGTEPRQALAKVLETADVQLAPYTFEHVDWMYDTLYLRALNAKDADGAQRIREAYMEHLGRALTFAESLAADTFDRPIPHILLMHTNRLNADTLADTLQYLKSKGYTFVTMETAMQDAAYKSDDVYYHRYGVSWLHRWRQAKELDLRIDEAPDVPTWVQEAYDGR